MPRRPKTLSYKDQLQTLLTYQVRRQLQGRPTTLRQLSKRMGLGAPYVQGLLERSSIQYSLISYVDTPKTHLDNVEILLGSMPEKLAAEMGVDLEALAYSYNRVMREETEPLERVEERKTPTLPGEEVLEELDSVDPYARYRISEEQYAALRHQLISFQELMTEARMRGYKTTAIRKATGGSRMRYPLAGPLWRPYLVGKKRYYLRELLKNLDQSDKMYLHQSVAKRRKAARKGKEEPQKLIDFGGRERRLDSVRRSGKRAIQRAKRRASVNEMVEIP